MIFVKNEFIILTTTATRLAMRWVKIWANIRLKNISTENIRSAIQETRVMCLTCSRRRRTERILDYIQCTSFRWWFLCTDRHLSLSTATSCCPLSYSRTAYNLDQTLVRSSQTCTVSSACQPQSDAGSARTHGLRYHDMDTDPWWRHTLDSTNPDRHSYTLPSEHQYIMSCHRTS